MTMFLPEATFQFFGFFDAFAILFWLTVIIIGASNTKSKNKQLAHYRYYSLGLFVKIISAVIFSIIYLIKYEGGDTVAYWDCAQKLNNLFFYNIKSFFQEFLFSEPDRVRYLHFDLFNTGMPPEWIYKEEEGWFTSKIMFFLSLITFRSYFAMTILCAFLSFKASWKLFEMGIKYNAGTMKNLAIATLFLPSTAFWCTGISKDMVVYFCVIYSLYYLFLYFDKNEKKGFGVILKISILFFLMANIRNFMLAAALLPFVFALGLRIANNDKYSKIGQNSIKFLIIIGILMSMVIFFGSQKAEEFSHEAQVIQTDLKNNSEYGGTRYDLGITDYTPIGMLKAMPISIFTAMYRPFIWESNSVFVLISALETFLFLIFTIRIPFRIGFIKLFRIIQKNDFLVMCLVFTLILGYFAGYTSGLFGVLVRFKAPLLPFFYILLTTKSVDEKKIIT